jgi:hypothetical protein
MADLRCLGNGCGRKIGETTPLEIQIMCPRCGRIRTIPVLELVAALSEYLGQVQAAAETSQAGAGGFTL